MIYAGTFIWYDTLHVQAIIAQVGCTNVFLLLSTMTYNLCQRSLSNIERKHYDCIAHNLEYYQSFVRTKTCISGPTDRARNPCLDFLGFPNFLVNHV